MNAELNRRNDFKGLAAYTVEACFTWMLFVLSWPVFAGITFSQNQFEIVIAPECNHVPISVPYTPDPAPYDESAITVSSDSSWAIPSVNTAQDRIEISFLTENLIASYTATISVDDGEEVTELFIHVTVPPLDIYRLLDDPLRSKTYGIQRNGINKGSIIAFDPVQGTPISCLTVGESPTDFVINDDSTELLVINSVGKSIDIIDLVTFTLKETITLPTYSAWGEADDTTANIALGPDDIIYYIDGSWGPILHVFKRSTGTVIQSITFDGSSPSNITGFMDIGITSDKTKMVAMPQYGWSAGVHYPTIGQYTINVDGTVNFIKQTSVTGISREPFEAPVLIRDDDQIAVMKTISTDPDNIDNLDRSFPSAIWSMNPNGSIVATGDKLYEYDTGIELYTIPGGSTTGTGYTYTKAQAFTSDFTRFIYFNPSNRTLNVVNLVDEIGYELMGRSLSPANGSVVTSPDTLIWSPLPGIDQYDIYLGTDSAAVSAADLESPLYLGRVTGSSLALTQTIIEGAEYYWRVDPVTDYGTETGDIYSFTVSDVALDKSKINVQTISGHSDFQIDIQLTSEEPGVSWTATAADPWVTFTQNSGSTPSMLSVHLDTTALSTGFHASSIILTTGAGELQIPVQLEVEALNITHINCDRTSVMCYAISEDTASAVPRAYLLEIDTETEKIGRVIRVGSSVTDITIHYPDNLIYVTNWKSGNLLEIDRDTFTHNRSYAFNPAGATGYSQGDVYRVAAGVSERLVVEEEDQWIDISIYNTSTETVLNQAFVREGGGSFDPTGRYYYHGDNNSSGAAITKFDIAGDIFTQLASVRPPEISSYYGSRTVVVSEDGSRIFWAGVVFDKDLDTEWGVGDIIYSTTADGRYAFGNTEIYDVNLKSKILSMTAGATVSGYNSTSAKLVKQIDDNLKFYPLSTLISVPAPVLSAGNPTINSIDLNWTDDSEETQFDIQRRYSGFSSWSNITTTAANVTSYTASGLLAGSTYEFRIRASFPEYSSAWSNIVTFTTIADTDHDGIGDDLDTDDDNDGISDADELAYGLDPLDSSDATQDFDNDGLNNLMEIQRGTDINDPDSDDDGILDGDEIYENLLVVFDDDTGDGDSIDVVRAALNFDPMTGTYTLRAQASPEKPFRDSFYLLLNLGSQQDKCCLFFSFYFYQVFNPTTQITITGQDITLKSWVAGNQIVASGTSIDGYPYDFFSFVGDDLIGDGSTASTVILDSDADGVGDVDDLFPMDPGESSDADADGIGDNADPDDDNDGMSDDFENTYGLDPHDASDAVLDPDADGLSNLEEYQSNRNPVVDERRVVSLINNLLLGDSNSHGNDGIGDYTDTDADGDGIPDDYELSHGLNPLYAGDASQDEDGDGLTNLEEFIHGSDINTADSDGDGVDDGLEVTQHRNPTVDERIVIPIINSILLGE